LQQDLRKGNVGIQQKIIEKFIKLEEKEEQTKKLLEIEEKREEE